MLARMTTKSMLSQSLQEALLCLMCAGRSSAVLAGPRLEVEGRLGLLPLLGAPPLRQSAGQAVDGGDTHICFFPISTRISEFEARLKRETACQ